MVVVSRRSFLYGVGAVFGGILVQPSVLYAQKQDEKKEIKAVDIVLTDINPRSKCYDEQLSLEQHVRAYKGITLLNFWEPWCSPCMNEMPWLQRVYAEGRVNVLGVSRDWYKSVEDERRWKNQRTIIDKVTYPLLGSREDHYPLERFLKESFYFGEDKDGNLKYFVPLTLIITPDFFVKEVIKGSVEFEELRKILQKYKEKRK